VSRLRSDIDLEVFSREASSVPEPRRRWTRFLLPLVVLLGFGAVLLWSLGDVLFPRHDVSVVRPRMAEGGTVPGAVAVQASGWVEPDPFAKNVVPLTRGTVAEVLVQESDRVERGDVIARLVADDAELELVRARARRDRAEAEHSRADVDLRFAKQDFEAAITLTERLAVARAELDGTKAESKRLAEAAARTRSEVRVAEEELTVQRYLAGEGAAGPRQVELAQARLDTARAASAAADARAARAVADIGVAEAKLASAKTDEKLRIADRRAVALAETGLDLAKAELETARAELAIAELRRKRVEVRSPWAGVVLERLTEPGAAAGETAIVSLYDPNHLRVRVDVPQEEVGKVFVGQVASIRCESRRDTPYAGEVVRVTQRADIQRVTLEAHVRVADPDGLLRPEMLCQVRFIASVDAGSKPDGPTTVLVPARFVVDGSRIWVLDAMTDAARLRTIEVGARSGDWVVVRSGLNLSDKLIDDGRAGLQDGMRLRVKR